jgi:hypothetical protein
MEDESELADSSLCAEDLFPTALSPENGHLRFSSKPGKPYRRKRSDAKDTHNYKALLDLNLSVIEQRSGRSGGGKKKALRLRKAPAVYSREPTEEAKTALEFSPRDVASPTDNAQGARGGQDCSILSFESFGIHNNMSAPSQILSEDSVHESFKPALFHPYAEVQSPWEETWQTVTVAAITAAQFLVLDVMLNGVLYYLWRALEVTVLTPLAMAG